MMYGGPHAAAPALGAGGPFGPGGFCVLGREALDSRASHALSVL